MAVGTVVGAKAVVCLWSDVCYFQL